MNSFMIEAGRKRRATVTVEEQPGAHTGASRKYIPGYSDSNIVFLNTSTGNDGNTGASIAQAVLTYAQAATLAGSTKKIRVVNDGAAFTANVTKPTEMTVGVSGTISSSLTAPVDTWTQAGTPSFGGVDVYAICWSEKLAKFIAAGGSNKIAYSSDGNAWTQAANTSFTSGNILGVCWSPDHNLAIAVGQDGQIAYSSDANTWSQATSVITENLNSVCYAHSLGVFVAGGIGKMCMSDDGVTWSRIINTSFSDGVDEITSIVWADGLSLLVATAVGGSGKIAYSSDGNTWTQAATPSFGSSGIYSVSYSATLNRLIATGDGGKIAYSSDGNTWTQAATPSFGASTVYGSCWVPEIAKYIAVGNSGKIAYSADGDAWTQSATPSFGASIITGVAYSPLLAKVISVSASGKLAYSTAYTTTISAAVAGFSIQAVQYSGTVTAYNCTLKQPGTTAALSTENCRFTESGAHISNNVQNHQGLLVEGDIHFTTTPAAQNAFSFTRYTVAGRVCIHNASATYFEEIKDGIVTDGISADYQVVVESGNVRGTCTNVAFGLGISVADPAFVDTTDYQLKREVNGYDEDSVCVAKSSYYYNSVGTRRDIGAWSYNETNETYIYERAYEMRKPSAKDATSHLERLQTSLYWGEDQTPDVATDPEARGEELALSYRTLPVADINFIRYLRTLKDPTVRIDYDPQWQPATTVTVDGNQSAGEDVLLLLTSTLEAGQKLTIAGKSYYVMRMNGTTKAVLNQPLADGVTNGDVLTVSDAIGKGVYQVVPQSEMNLTRFYENNTAYFKGAVLKFVRKSP